jgi:hypothetical protein
MGPSNGYIEEKCRSPILPSSHPSRHSGVYVFSNAAEGEQAAIEVFSFCFEEEYRAVGILHI